MNEKKADENALDSDEKQLIDDDSENSPDDTKDSEVLDRFEVLEGTHSFNSLEDDLLKEVESAKDMFESAKENEENEDDEELQENDEELQVEELLKFQQKPDMETALSHYWKVSNMRVVSTWMQHFVAQASFNLGYYIFLFLKILNNSIT